MFTCTVGRDGRNYYFRNGRRVKRDLALRLHPGIECKRRGPAEGWPRPAPIARAQLPKAAANGASKRPSAKPRPAAKRASKKGALAPQRRPVGGPAVTRTAVPVPRLCVDDLWDFRVWEARLHALPPGVALRDYLVRRARTSLLTWTVPKGARALPKSSGEPARSKESRS